MGSHALRLFRLAADIIEGVRPGLAEKLRRATPHWMRHTDATHALAKGVGLSAVRDNLRHASISTTSIYLLPPSPWEFTDGIVPLAKLAGIPSLVFLYW